jgi:curved DNA-binding protein CbpA
VGTHTKIWVLEDREVSGDPGDMHGQPWGRSLAELAQARRSGDVVVRVEAGKDAGKEIRIALEAGEIVAASSPFIADSVVRIALTGHLIAPRMIAAITERLAADPSDEIAAVADIARLSADHATVLRRRVIRHRTARTFALAGSRARVTHRFEPTGVPRSGVRFDEIAAAIYVGALAHLAEDRLAADLCELGLRFQLAADADLARFGFGTDEQPLLDSLRAGVTLAELDARHREISPRTQQAVVYALATWGACVASGRAPAVPRTMTPSRAATTEWERPRQATITELVSRARTTEWKPRPAPAPAAPAIPRTLTPRRATVAIREAIATGCARLDAGADHYELLGVPRDASLAAIRAAYLQLVALLHKDKLPPAIQVDPHAAAAAHKLFAAVNAAFGVLSDPARRTAYDAGTLDGDAPPVDPRVRADEEFQRGVRALRREDMVDAIDALARATALVPQDVDYAAMLAWARFCASTDKRGIADGVRRALERAISRSPNPMMARFYLGRVERILGRTTRALHHFREVLELEPGHADAAAEIRCLERLEAKPARR